MLDEKKEFQEYLYDIDAADAPAKRIQYQTFVKQYSGIRRALNIITRGLLEESQETFGDLSLQEKNFLATAGQKLWMGLEVEAANEREKEILNWLKNRHPFIGQWLKQYLEKVLIPSRRGRKDEKDSIEKLRNCLKELPGKAERMEKDSLGQKIYAIGSNKITYGEIAYNALLRGPLRVYALCCRTTEFADMQKIVSKGKEEEHWKNTLTKNDKDVILKLTAAYLLEMRKAEYADRREARFVPVNEKDIWNWTIPAKPKLDNYGYQYEALFEFKTLAGNQMKIKCNQEWLSACEWELLDVTEGMQPVEAYLKAHPGYTVYLDGGGGKPLKKFA